jgi:hypothetical protein
MNAIERIMECLPTSGLPGKKLNKNNITKRNPPVEGVKDLSADFEKKKKRIQVSCSLCLLYNLKRTVGRQIVLPP